MADVRDTFVLATKVGRLLVPDPTRDQDVWSDDLPPVGPVFDYSYDGTMRSLEESLERLGLDRVDILHIHDPDNHYGEALKGSYRALARLRDEGVIRAVGAGMNQAKMLARFAREGDFDCFLCAGRYTLVDHTALKRLLPLCEERKISLIIGGPYNSGILAQGSVDGAKFDYRKAPPQIVERVRRIEEVCGRHGTPLKAAALQFPLAHPAVAAVIPGARSPGRSKRKRKDVRIRDSRGFLDRVTRGRTDPRRGADAGMKRDPLKDRCISKWYPESGTSINYK